MNSSFFWSPAAGVTLHLSFGALQESAPAQSKQGYLGHHWDWRGAFMISMAGCTPTYLHLFPGTLSPLG